MRKRKLFLAGCAIMAGAGILIAAAGIAMGGAVRGISLDSDGFHINAAALQAGDGRSEYIKKQETMEEFDFIDIAIDYADINIEASDSGEYAVSYCIDADVDFICEVQDKKLVVKEKHSPAMFHNISWFSFGYSANHYLDDFFVTIYVPQGKELADVTAKADTGNVTCRQIEAGSMNIASDYGDAGMEEVKAASIELAMNTGSIVCRQIEAGSMKAATDYGNVKLLDMETGSMGIVMDSGSLMMQQIRGDNCAIKDDYGNITLENVTLSEDMEIKGNSGDIKCNNVSVRSLYLDSDYGKVNGEHLVCQNGEVKMNSGDFKLEDAAFDNWKMISDYGNVELGAAKPLENYRYNLTTEYGKVTLDGEKMGESYRSILQDKDKENVIEIDCDSGDIEVYSYRD